MQLAVALYHNDVDDEDELEFRKGDVLTVLIENPNGLSGWWLCEHRGKCGLCPANRLKLLSNSQYQAQTRSSARLSTASVSATHVRAIDFVIARSAQMYDSLGNTDYDIPITATTSSNHDYDIPHRSGKSAKQTFRIHRSDMDRSLNLINYDRFHFHVSANCPRRLVTGIVLTFIGHLFKC